MIYIYIYLHDIMEYYSAVKNNERMNEILLIYISIYLSCLLYLFLDT